MIEEDYAQCAQRMVQGLGGARREVMPPAQRQRDSAPLLVEIERAEQAVDLLVSMVDQMRDRLRVVSSPQPPTRQEAGVCPELGGSPAAAAVSGIANRIQAQAYELKEAIELLEI